MKWLLTLCVVAAFLYPGAASSVTQYKSDQYAGKGVSLTLDDPIGSVYRAGEEMGVSIRTDSDAYVVVFNIDTDGFVHLLYPEKGENLQRFSSNRVYEIPEDPSRSLVVGGAKGIEFLFAVAVENRDYINEEEIRFLADNETLPENRKFRITGDPLLGANRIASQLVRGISHRPGVTMSFTYFYIDEAVDFPRYLCEDCYESGKDPYAKGTPVYVAGADFAKTERLTYPLEEGFVRDYPESPSLEYAGFSTEESSSNVTKVYVSYYPRWDDGFYSTSWWYLDPWYWGGWYAPYPPGVYVGIGWWDWWDCRYSYFPYYPYPYYPYYPYDPYYPYNPGYDATGRSFRPVAKDGYNSDLHTAMNHKSSKDLRSRQVASVSPKGYDRTGVKGPSNLDRKSVTSKYAPGGKEPRVIRSRPTVDTKTGREGRPSRLAREVRSKTTTHREQRVITRSPTSTRSTTGGKRSIDTKRIEGRMSGEVNRTWNEPRKSQINTPTRDTRSKTQGRAYTPTVRRDGGSGKSSAPRSGQSSGRSSSRGSSSSSGKSSSSSRMRR